MGRGGRITIADVASRAGVSPGAVSFALNDRPGVAAETRRRILDVATSLGWQPSHRGRALSRSSSATVAVVVARPTRSAGADPFFPAFVAGANRALAPRGQSLLFTVVPDRESELATYRRLAAEQRVDGVLLTDLRVADPRPALLAELGQPAITLGRPDTAGEHPAVGSVSVDDVPGVYEIVRSLVAAGHRRIAHVTGPSDLLHVRRRREAWAAALGESGVRAGRCIHTDFGPGQGARATERLLRSAKPPTAIVFANDVMAIAALAVLQREGRRVPDDISITGFDDTELAQYVLPPLTSVRTDVSGWGERAAAALLDAIDGAPAEHIDLAPSVLVPRASTAPPPPPQHLEKGAP